MHVDIKTKGIDLTEAIRSAVEKRLAKLESGLLERFGEPVSVEVTVGKTVDRRDKGQIFSAEMRIMVPGKTVYAESRAEDLYVAIREARDRARRQLVEHKEKMASAG